YPGSFSGSYFDEFGDLICERPANLPPSTGCVITPEELAFNNDAYMLGQAGASHTHTLPSFNLKLDVAEDWVVRFAASRAMSRPDVGLLRNYVTVDRISPNLSNTSDPNIIWTNGQITGYEWQYRAQAGNPWLKPITADQF